MHDRVGIAEQRAHRAEILRRPLVVVEPDQPALVKRRGLQRVARGLRGETEQVDRRVLAQVGRDAAEESHQVFLRIDPDAFELAQFAREQDCRRDRFAIGVGHDRNAPARQAALLRGRRVALRGCRRSLVARLRAFAPPPLALVAHPVELGFGLFLFVLVTRRRDLDDLRLVRELGDFVRVVVVVRRAARLRGTGRRRLLVFVASGFAVASVARAAATPAPSPAARPRSAVVARFALRHGIDARRVIVEIEQRESLETTGAHRACGRRECRRRGDRFALAA